METEIERTPDGARGGMKMKVEFTKKELFEIEKFFDIHAGQSMRGLADVLDTLKGKGKEEFSQRLFNEAVEAYELFRTISAKACILREDDKNKGTN